MPFRTTPQLGPQLTDHALKFYWDPANITDASPRPGNPEYGSDGHKYILVKAGAAFTAGDGISINQSTWVASADASSPEWLVPADVDGGTVAINQYFWAREAALAVT